MEKREAKSRQSSKVERLRGIYFIDPGWPRLQRNSQKCEDNIGKAFGTSNAFQKERSNQHHEVAAKQELHPNRFQKTICGWKSGISWIHKATSGIFFAYKTQWSHCRQRLHFDDPLQFGSQIYSHASSSEDFGRKSCSGQGMEKNSRQIQHGNWKNSRVRRRLFSKHKETNESTLCYTDGHMSPQERGVRTKVTKIHWQSRALVRHCKRRLWSQRSLYWASPICVPDDCCKK